ncbi:PDZ domain-containing protein [Chloroflexota bacterium]
MVKEFLSQSGVSFTEKDVSVDSTAAQEIVSKTGQMAVPVTVFNGEFIVGFDQAKLNAAITRKSRQPKVPFGVDAANAAGVQGLAATSGAYIGAVKPGSPAARIGVQPKDIIVNINQQDIRKVSDLQQTIAALDAGSLVLVTIQRGGVNRALEGVL